MNKVKKVVALGGIVGVIAVGSTGCGIKPFDKPEFVKIEASQTAFMIPLVGDSEDQASFESEEMLAKAKVATKEVQIPHRWVKTGWFPGQGEYRKSAEVIVVERTPETREWNSTKEGGTSAKNQAIYAESKESIGFSVGMNCSAQIYTEDDAIKFLYSYNNKTLEDIMDTEIRSRVETKFVEECAKYSADQILTKKESIMENVRNDVIPYFEEKGITITVLGMKDGIEYDDEEIQKAINEKFSSAQRLITQENNNEVTISKAHAQADAEIIKAEAEAEAVAKIAAAMTPEYIDYIQAQAWDGKLPTVQGASGTIIDIGESVNTKDVQTVDPE